MYNNLAIAQLGSVTRCSYDSCDEVGLIRLTHPRFVHFELLLSTDAELGG